MDFSDAKIDILNKKKQLRKKYYNTIGILLSGCFAGVISRSCTAPFDRIRVLIQSQVKINNKPMKSVRQCIKYVYRYEGILAFFKYFFINIIEEMELIVLKLHLKLQLNSIYMKKLNYFFILVQMVILYYQDFYQVQLLVL